MIRISGRLVDRISIISLWRDNQGYVLEIPTAGCYWIASDGSVICHESQPTDADPAFLRGAILGPPLMLALAVRDIWCLHASAIEYDDNLIAFLGESGTGKSTLVAYLARQTGFRQVSDDILPVTRENNQLYALPHFPQLKIPIDRQPGFVFPGKMPLHVIYFLDEQPSFSIQGLSPAYAALVMAGHTVAASLFDRQLLSRHFNFCSRVVSDIHLRRLAYTRTQPELPIVWQRLKDDLADLVA
jgi:hypothetical protein